MIPTIRWTHAFVMAFGLALALTFGVGSAQAADSLADYLPEGALGSVELSGLAGLIEKIENSDIPRAIEESDGYKKFADSDAGRKARGGQALIEGQLGMGLWKAVKRIAGDQAILAVYPPSEGRQQPDGVLLVRLADDQIGPLVKEKLAPFVQLAGDKVVAEDRDGSWRLRSRDEKVHAALRGRWVVVSSDASKLDFVLSGVAKPDVPSGATLGDSPAWKDLAVKSQAGDTWATVCVDLQRLHAVMNKDRLLPSKTDNPVVSLLLGGLLECAALSPRAHGSLLVGSNEFTVSAKLDQKVDQLDAAHRTLFAPRVTSQPVLTPDLPRRLGSLEFSRAWADWYKSRDQLLEAKVLPEFDKFETGLATFLPGKDFAEDVLALLGKPMTFVAAQQTFPHLEGHPGVQLPAFGVVLELNDAQKGADLFNVFFQTITSISNIEAGKYGRQPWVLGSESFQGIQLAFAKYLQTPKGTELPIVYNFQPASALVGKNYVAATSLELCRDLVSALQKKPVSDASPKRSSGVDVNFELNLDPNVAAELLHANRAALEAVGLQQGKTASQVKQEFDAGQALLRALTPWQLRTIVHEKTVELRLTGGWQ
jgi:hypothetical protein